MWTVVGFDRHGGLVFGPCHGVGVGRSRHDVANGVRRAIDASV